VETPPAEAGRGDGIVVHYRDVDPHAAVAASRAGFYENALRHFGRLVPGRPRALLDVGCGFGYFLAQAAAAGWDTAGVDIVPDAVRAAGRRVPSARLVCADLRGSGLPAGILQAISAWDVIDIVPEPEAELAECLRLLAPGGVIGLRFRNLTGQLWLYRFCRCFLTPWRRAGIKNPFIFHRFSFTPAAIRHLLERSGFVDIVCTNSPLTQGDPYAYSAIRGLAGVGKRVVSTVANLIAHLSGGRVLVGPSLLVWARKADSGTRPVS
jgi:SAM-dependent methyltransferase